MLNQTARRNVIDIEASGLSSAGYPIEIGVVLDDGAQYQALLKPMEEWCYWDKDAESLHGVTRTHLLKNGRSIVEVCRELNAFCKGQTVFSDCWVLDNSWLNQMFSRAGVAKQFSCTPIEAILDDAQRELYPVCKVLAETYSSDIKHRALEDAVAIQLSMYLLENGCSVLDDPSSLSIARWCHHYLGQISGPIWADSLPEALFRKSA